MKRVEKRKGKNQKDGEGKGKNKRVEKRWEKIIQAEQGRRGKKEQEASESIRKELTQDSIPSKDLVLGLKGRELTFELSRAPLTWKRKQIMKD